MKLTEAIILAGGFGTRLHSVVSDRPKSMALINGRPFLEYLFDHLLANGITTIILSVGFKSNYISHYFGPKYKDCILIYATEETPLGTGGAILNSMQYTDTENVLVTNGDSLLLVEIQDQFNVHEANSADATLALLEKENTDRFGTVQLAEDGKILQFIEKKRLAGKGLINGGLYIINRTFFKNLDFPKKFSVEKECFERLVDSNRFYGYITDAYFLDIGIPEDFKKAQVDFARLYS